MGDGGEAVCGDQHGASVARITETSQELSFGLGVHGAQTVVQDQDARVARKRARDAGALPLSSGEGDAALTYELVEAVGELCDLLGHAGGLDQALELFVLEVFVGAEEEVVSVRVREQEAVLRDIAQRTA